MFCIFHVCNVNLDINFQKTLKKDNTKINNVLGRKLPRVNPKN